MNVIFKTYGCLIGLKNTSFMIILKINLFIYIFLYMNYFDIKLQLISYFHFYDSLIVFVLTFSLYFYFLFFFLTLIMVKYLVCESALILFYYNFVLVILDRMSRTTISFVKTKFGDIPVCFFQPQLIQFQIIRYKTLS